jgi:ABC-type transport system involved in cytochrome c biogenesis permease subunit
MKKLLPWLSLAFAVLWLGSLWRPQSKSPEGFDTVAFGELPVLSGGRLKPFDTVGRNTLLIINGKQKVRLEDGRRLGPDQWLLDVLFNAQKADTYPVFLIDNSEVLGLFGWQKDKRRRFSYRELAPFLDKIDEEGGKSTALESTERSPYQTAVLNLRNSLQLYQQLRTGMRPPDAADFSGELSAYEASIEAGRKAIQAQANHKEFDRKVFASFVESLGRYDWMSRYDRFRPIPPDDPNRRKANEWLPVGGALLEAALTGKLSPAAAAYARIGDAARTGDAAAFNREVTALAGMMKSSEAETTKRTGFERLFNHLQPFYAAMGLYVFAALLACVSWLACGPELRRAAVWMLLVALAIHTFGLGARMYLQGRPPVTNLYSSAVFIGWGMVIIGLVLERIFRYGIGAAAAGATGFVSLIIAQHLASSGDTLQMLQAVLDTNIWLATHVVTITIGYSAMFFAGLLAIFYVAGGLFTRLLDKTIAAALYRMVYGVVCFAAFFSFIGTLLGGIWADQSWGRFWGWDPKENGALLIVLWCAILLHARGAGYIRARGFMAGAIFGNIVTAFSWFGVNMLGVGLHSYGFMDKAFWWLIAFMASQATVILVAAVPTEYWRSFRKE